MSNKTEGKNLFEIPKGKSRGWKLLLYPDSAPEDWKELLDESCVKYVCALHDKDQWDVRDEKKNPEHKKGDLKKAHYHILLLFDGPKTYNRVLPLAEKIKAKIPFEMLDGNPSGFMRYMLHLDQPKKHQYPEEILEAHNGAVIDISKADDDDVIYDEIFDFLETSEIHNFYLFQRYARKAKPKWFKFSRVHSYQVACLIKAKLDFIQEQKELDKQTQQPLENEVSELAEQAMKVQENEVIRKLEAL